MRDSKETLSAWEVSQRNEKIMQAEHAAGIDRTLEPVPTDDNGRPISGVRLPMLFEAMNGLADKIRREGTVVYGKLRKK